MHWDVHWAVYNCVSRGQCFIIVVFQVTTRRPPGWMRAAVDDTKRSVNCQRCSVVPLRVLRPGSLLQSVTETNMASIIQKFSMAAKATVKNIRVRVSMIMRELRKTRRTIYSKMTRSLKTLRTALVITPDYVRTCNCMMYCAVGINLCRSNMLHNTVTPCVQCLCEKTLRFVESNQSKSAPLVTTKFVWDFEQRNSEIARVFIEILWSRAGAHEVLNIFAGAEYLRFGNPFDRMYAADSFGLFLDLMLLKCCA